MQTEPAIRWLVCIMLLVMPNDHNKWPLFAHLLMSAVQKLNPDPKYSNDY